MKKLFRYITAVCIAVSVAASAASAFAAANVIKINGEAAEIPEGMGQIREKDSRTFVPLRFVSEFLNNEVWFMDDTQTAGIMADDMLLFVQNGNSVLFKATESTGEQSNITMDTSAYIEPSEGRMYVPIRFLAEAIGYTVGWDPDTETVTLDKSE